MICLNPIKILDFSIGGSGLEWGSETSWKLRGTFEPTPRAGNRMRDYNNLSEEDTDTTEGICSPAVKNLLSSITHS